MQKKILIVDDDLNLQKLLKVNFEKAGYIAISVFDGKNIVKQIQQQDVPDLIVLDIMLPGIDGYTICQQLREKTTTILTPILILSSKDSPTDKIAALKLGADEYVTKPFDIGELVARVGALLQRTEQILSANPLTGLPGNLVIMREVNKRLKVKENFSCMYLDIDNFKAYNDKYGFNKGDEIIKFTAEIIKHSVAEKDFVGHIGGDDFVLICDVEKTEITCQNIINLFDAKISQYYNTKDRDSGYIMAVNRQGKRQRFSIMALSIGVVKNDNRQELYHYGKIIEVATEMKGHAKMKKVGVKSNFVVDRRK
ncbi:MAG: response regulator [Elusimicrobiota bacterium]